MAFTADNVLGGCVARHVAVNPGADALQEVDLIADPVNQKNQWVRACCSSFADYRQILLQISFGGEKQDIRIAHCRQDMRIQFREPSSILPLKPALRHIGTHFCGPLVRTSTSPLLVSMRERAPRSRRFSAPTK